MADWITDPLQQAMMTHKPPARYDWNFGDALLNAGQAIKNLPGRYLQEKTAQTMGLVDLIKRAQQQSMKVAEGNPSYNPMPILNLALGANAPVPGGAGAGGPALGTLYLRRSRGASQNPSFRSGHSFDVIDEHGNYRTDIDLEHTPKDVGAEDQRYYGLKPGQIYVNRLGQPGRREDYGMLGRQDVKSLLTALGSEFPGASSIAGFRVGGMRAGPAGRGAAKGEKRMPQVSEEQRAQYFKEKEAALAKAPPGKTMEELLTSRFRGEPMSSRDHSRLNDFEWQTPDRELREMQDRVHAQNTPERDPTEIAYDAYYGYGDLTRHEQNWYRGLPNRERIALENRAQGLVEQRNPLPEPPPGMRPTVDLMHQYQYHYGELTGPELDYLHELTGPQWDIARNRATALGREWRPDTTHGPAPQPAAPAELDPEMTELFRRYYTGPIGEERSRVSPHEELRIFDTLSDPNDIWSRYYNEARRPRE
jgi:hypothetical protein